MEEEREPAVLAWDFSMTSFLHLPMPFELIVILGSKLVDLGFLQV